MYYNCHICYTILFMLYARLSTRDFIIVYRIHKTRQSSILINIAGALRIMRERPSIMLLNF